MVSDLIFDLWPRLPHVYNRIKIQHYIPSALPLPSSQCMCLPAPLRSATPNACKRMKSHITCNKCYFPATHSLISTPLLLLLSQSEPLFPLPFFGTCEPVQNNDSYILCFTHLHSTEATMQSKNILPYVLCSVALWWQAHSHTQYHVSSTPTLEVTRMSSTPRLNPCTCRKAVNSLPRALSSWLATAPP